MAVVIPGVGSRRGDTEEIKFFQHAAGRPVGVSGAWPPACLSTCRYCAFTAVRWWEDGTRSFVISPRMLGRSPDRDQPERPGQPISIHTAFTSSPVPTIQPCLMRPYAASITRTITSTGVHPASRTGSNGSAGPSDRRRLVAQTVLYRVKRPGGWYGLDRNTPRSMGGRTGAAVSARGQATRATIKRKTHGWKLNFASGGDGLQ